MVARNDLGIDEVFGVIDPLGFAGFLQKPSMYSLPTNETLAMGTLQPASRASRINAAQAA